MLEAASSKSQLSPQLLRRLSLGIGANALSQVVTVVLLLGTLPLLLHAWGTQTYGLWIVLTAVPSYLAMGDLGFSMAAANDMTMAAARRDFQSARRTQLSLLLMSLLMLLGLGMAACIGAYLAPDEWLPSTRTVTTAEVRATIAVLSLSTLGSLGWNSISACFRAAGLYPAAVVFNEFVRLIEALAIVAVALCGGDVLKAASASFAVRLVALVVALWTADRRISWVSLDLREARLGHLAPLWRPALAVMALPLGFALSLQAMTLVVGSVAGLAAVALFSPLRSLTRLVVQAASIVTHAIMPELSLAIGRQDIHDMKRLIRWNWIWSSCIAVPFFVAASLFGVWFIEFWSGGRLHPTHLIVIALAGSAALQALWNSSGNMLLAANRQAAYSYWFILVSLLSISSAVLLGKVIGLPGIGAAMVIADAIVLVIVMLQLRSLTLVGGGS